MTETTTLLNSKKYLALVDETEWSVFPGSPTYHMPVTEYGVLLTPDNRQAKRYVGLLQPKHNRNWRGMPRGSLNCGLHGYKPAGAGSKSLAQLMLEWAFANHESQTPPSKSAEWYEGPNVANKRHTGLRANQATLAGSQDSGVLDLSLDLLGHAEAGNTTVSSAQTLPTDRELLVDFEFPDIEFELDGTALPLASFQWQVQTALKAEYLNSRSPHVLKKTQHIETLTITPLKEDDTWDAFRRELVSMVETDASLTIKGFHNGTGTADTDYAQCVIDWPRLSLVTVAEEGGMDDLAKQPLTFVCLKPDTSSNCSSMTWSDVAAS